MPAHITHSYTLVIINFIHMAYQLRPFSLLDFPDMQRQSEARRDLRTERKSKNGKPEGETRKAARLCYTP